MKPFYGYNNKKEALKYFPDLEKGVITTKTVDVVDDSTKWPQTSSKQETYTRIELPHAIVAFDNEK